MSFLKLGDKLCGQITWEAQNGATHSFHVLCLVQGLGFGVEGLRLFWLLGTQWLLNILGPAAPEEARFRKKFGL